MNPSPMTELAKALEDLCQKLDVFWNADDRPSIAIMRGSTVSDLAHAQENARKALAALTAALRAARKETNDDVG